MDIFGRLDSRVLQHLSFGRRMQKFRIDRKGRVATLVLGDGDLVRLGEGQELLAAGEIPFAPRGDDADIGLQRIIAELEADMVVALARRAMTAGVRPNFSGDHAMLFGDATPSDARDQYDPDPLELSASKTRATTIP